jgi:hypothetical protein
MFVAAEKVPAHLAKQLGLVNELAEDPVAAFVSRDLSWASRRERGGLRIVE